MLATAGVRHLKVWSLDNELTCKSAHFESSLDNHLTSVAFQGDRALTGTSDGQLLVWKIDEAGNIHMDDVVKSIDLHPKQPLDSVYVDENNEFVITGGRDGGI